MKALEIWAKFLAWAALLYLVTLCWIGAEWLFEGVVHSSKVDGFVAGTLAFYMVRDIDHIDREILRRREDHAKE